MDVLMQERFKQQYYNLSPSFSDYTFIKKIPKDTFIYRSGLNEVSETRATRLKEAETRLNQAFLKKPKGKQGVFFPYLPNFFGPPHTAALYASNNNSQLYKWKLKNDLNLISLQGDEGIMFLNNLWNTTYNTVDKAITQPFFSILGYVPIEHKQDNYYREHREFIQSKVIADDNHIILSENYIDKDATFNRVSTTKVDKAIFQGLLNHTFQDTKINELFKACAGFHFPPMNCGFINLDNFITLYEQFHEEIYIRDEIILALNEKKEYIYIEDNNFSIEVIHLPEYYIDGFSIIDLEYPNTNPIDEITLFRYIHTFSKAFTAVFSTTDDLIHDIQSMLDRSTKNISNVTSYIKIEQRQILEAERSAIVFSQSFFIRRRSEIQYEIYNIIKESFTFNSKYFKFLPEIENDPFVKDGALYEDIYIYTALSDILRSAIKSYQNILTKFDLENFIPVVMGGALFSLYSFSAFRKFTKDIDIKINDKLSIEEDPINEYNHTKLLIITHIWKNLINNLFDYISTPRIQFYNKKISEVKEYPSIRRLADAKYSSYLDVIVTKQKFKEILFDDYVKSIDPNYKEGTVLVLFHNHLVSTMKITLLQYIHLKQDILLKKFELKQKNSLNTDEYMNKKKELNNQLSQLEGIFNRFIIGYNPQAEPIINKLNTITNRINLRNYIGPNNYKIGYFSSLWIKRSETSKFGLIDFTFDTPYSLEGTIQTPSKLKLDGIVHYNSLFFASYLDFIRETIKLKNICNTVYVFDDLGLDRNIFNKCSPNKDNRLRKQIKYNLRYNLVYELAKTLILKEDYVPPILSPTTLEQVLEVLEHYLSRYNIKEHDFSVSLGESAIEKQKRETIIGGSFTNKKIKKMNKTLKKVHTNKIIRI